MTLLHIMLSLVLVLPGTSNEPTLKPHILTYIETYKYLAIDEMDRSGIPASVTLAQAILESNGGISKLARESNNHFGIKCKDYWTGDRVLHPDDDRDAQGRIIPSCFRKYPSVAASYADRTEFLRKTPGYQILFDFDKTDYEAWSHGLQWCGYATDAAYGEKLIRTIELYGLDDLDYYTIKYYPKSG